MLKVKKRELNSFDLSRVAFSTEIVEAIHHFIIFDQISVLQILLVVIGI